MIRPLLHAIDPYEGFDASVYPVDLFGWGSTDSIFEQVIREVKPKLIIEVGTWKGASAIHMAKLLNELGLEAETVCVDTFLGAVEFWDNHDDDTRYKALKLIHGYPSVYYQFLANVVHCGTQQVITPFPQTSSIAADWFTNHKVQADLVYIDGSHRYNDVLADLYAYWPLVRQGGLMFGDDLDTFLDVRRALDTFCADKRLTFANVDGRKWIIRKSRGT